MDEQELRSIVRDAIARHAAAAANLQINPRQDQMPSNIARQHASHALFPVPAGSDTGGACVIEPAVACNHCGYCKSYGH
jgi:hypothetical protein